MAKNAFRDLGVSVTLTLDQLVILQDLLEDAVINWADDEGGWYRTNLNTMALQVDDLIDDLGEYDKEKVVNRLQELVAQAKEEKDDE